MTLSYSDEIYGELDMRSSKPITVTLGNQQRGVDARLESGAYDSASEVLRAALRALDREEEVINQIMRAKVQEALDDPRPSRDADEVFDKVERIHSERMKAAGRDI
jgi:antitoxin ParD1/3/4